MMYIDPLSGSIILQAIAAGALAGAVAFRDYWGRLRDGTREWWKRRRGK